MVRVKQDLKDVIFLVKIFAAMRSIFQSWGLQVCFVIALDDAIFRFAYDGGTVQGLREDLEHFEFIFNYNEYWKLRKGEVDALLKGYAELPKEYVDSDLRVGLSHN